MDTLLFRNMERAPVTVAIVLNSSWQAYNFRLNLARALKEEGHKVVFIAPYDEKYSEILKQEFDFYPVHIDPKGMNPLQDFKTMLSLFKLFRSIRPNVVMNFTIKPNIYSAISAGILGIKVINNITGLGTIFIKESIVTKLAKLLYKVALGFSNKVFFQNSDDMNLFVENGLVNKNKCALLPGSGVDLNKFTPKHKERENDTFVFLVIARLLKDKGIVEFIDACKIIKEKQTNMQCQLLGSVGAENQTAITKDELQTWVDQGLVNYLGTTDKVEDVIANADCVVLPSYREGTPRSLLEASAMEKPIITTNVVGCKEVVDDGVNGYLCEVNNAEDLAEKMQALLNLSQDERVLMGKAGREKITQEFDEKIVIKKYVQCLKEFENKEKKDV